MSIRPSTHINHADVQAIRKNFRAVGQLPIGPSAIESLSR